MVHTRSGTLAGAVIGGEPLSPRIRVVQVFSTKFPTQCRQCEDAPCVKVCPTGATHRTATYTAVNSNLCIGCRLCMMVCPFGAIHTAAVRTNAHTKRAAIKCDLCVDRKDGPACLAACPTKAISLATPKQVMENAIRDSSERYLAALQAQDGLGKQISAEGTSL
ncbi:MAG TPA: 4Fe-4S dicluster domain-containing protein [Candidatus Acidoferrales bacterium]|nr:4Fe-4S dicluster domain-containing protein [Candidatus Acidoferrales bacterium]